MTRKAKGTGSQTKRRRVQFEPLENRLCMAVSVGWDGPGLGSASLNYYVGTVPSTLDRGQVETALKTALDTWSKVADITFTPTSLPQQLNSIDFTFRVLDGVGRALAQGYFPNDRNSARIAGDVQFDSAESWEIGNSKGSSAFDLVQVAVHEVGHALGLDHLTAGGAVMFPSVSPNQTFSALGTADVNAILSVYAPADGVENTPTTPTTTTTPTTYRHPFGRRGGRNGRVEAAPQQLFAAANRWQNANLNQDVTGDGFVTPIDALRVINNLNHRGSHRLDDAEGEVTEDIGFVDCNGDGEVTPLDALQVINRLNQAVAEAETGDVTDPGDTTDPGVVNEECGTVDINDETTGECDGTDTESGTDTGTDQGTDTGTDTGTDAGTDDGTDTETDGGSDTGTEDGTDTGTDDGGDTETDDGGSSDDDEDEKCERADDRITEILSRYDENEDGLLTEEELPERVWEKLSQADTDHDGAISAAELEALHPARSHGPRVDIFAEFDANEDGMLTADEVTDELWTRISAADSDDDGAISIEELAAFHPRHAAMPRGNLFARFDANEDGLLTADEVTERLWLKLSEVDADDDGAVSVAELADFHPIDVGTRRPHPSHQGRGRR